MIEKVLFLYFLTVSYWLIYKLTEVKMLHVIYSFRLFHIMKFDYKCLLISYFKIMITGMFKSYRSKDKSIILILFYCWKIYSNLAADIYVTLDIAYLIHKFQERLQGKHLTVPVLFSPIHPLCQWVNEDY